MKPLLIFLAGGAGSLARYWTAGAAQRIGGSQFPFGTLCVNVIGCLLIGFLSAALSGKWQVREEYRVMVLVGFLGGFTTFSAFALESYKLITGREFGLAMMNVVLSVGLGFAAAWMGYRLSERWLGV
ncbi:MAG: fluoride efflux transporter CrcB [Planctomycetes bacterium]|nr:fluoride efflux transporter CrcB [Planctomycetota bacterium]